MRIGAILPHHDPRIDPPSHYFSASTAAALCAERISQGWSVNGVERLQFAATRVSKFLIHLHTLEPISSIRHRFQDKSSRLAKVPIPRLLPPLPPQNLDLAYPEAWRTTSGHPHHAFLEGRLVAADL